MADLGLFEAEFAHQAVELRVLFAACDRACRKLGVGITVCHALDIGLRSEDAFGDGGAGARVIEKGNRGLRVFDRDLKRRAQLLAIERAMAELVGPHRAAAGIILLALWIHVAEAALLGEGHRLVGISFARREAVSHASDQQVPDARFRDDRRLSDHINGNLRAVRIGQFDARATDAISTGGFSHESPIDPPFADRRCGDGHTLPR